MDIQEERKAQIFRLSGRLILPGLILGILTILVFIVLIHTHVVKDADSMPLLMGVNAGLVFLLLVATIFFKPGSVRAPTIALGMLAIVLSIVGVLYKKGTSSAAVLSHIIVYGTLGLSLLFVVFALMTPKVG